MKLLITGGAGFIGSNFVMYLQDKYRDYDITVLDLFTYAANPRNLDGFKGKIIRQDICAPIEPAKYDAVINFAAETHIDNSIQDASPFIKTNYRGVYNLLEYVRVNKIPKFIQMSTDEVYGDCVEETRFVVKDGVDCWINKMPHPSDEGDILKPSSPYSASKASGEMLCMAYKRTYNTPIIVIRPTNNYGKNQHPEKFIPMLISNALLDLSIPIYGTGTQSRDWLFVGDNCKAIDTILHKGKVGETYNVGAGNEQTNLEVAFKILALMGKSPNLIKYVADRPGHDVKYSVKTDKIQSLGWKPTKNFKDGLMETIEYYEKQNS